VEEEESDRRARRHGGACVEKRDWNGSPFRRVWSSLGVVLSRTESPGPATDVVKDLPMPKASVNVIQVSGWCFIVIDENRCGKNKCDEK
jgi:hypothetical protein